MKIISVPVVKCASPFRQFKKGHGLDVYHVIEVQTSFKPMYLDPTRACAIYTRLSMGKPFYTSAEEALLTSICSEDLSSHPTCHRYNSEIPIEFRIKIFLFFV